MSHAADTSLDPLVADLVHWVADEPRPYRDVIDTWRTSCPRLTVWEEAQERGYVERVMVEQAPHVVATEAGRAFCAARVRTR